MGKTVKKIVALLLAAVTVLGAAPLVEFFGAEDALTVTAEAAEVEMITENYNGHTYALIDLSMPWTEAKEYCEKLGGHLATITSEEEQKFITNLISSGKRVSYWIGATDVREEGVWEWVTGEEFKYSNWAAGMPDNLSGVDRVEENFAEIYNTGVRGKWNDLQNEGDSSDPYDERGILCEWEYKENYNKIEKQIKTLDKIKIHIVAKSKDNNELVSVSGASVRIIIDKEPIYETKSNLLGDVTIKLSELLSRGYSLNTLLSSAYIVASKDVNSSVYAFSSLDVKNSSNSLSSFLDNKSNVLELNEAVCHLTLNVAYTENEKEIQNILEQAAEHFWVLSGRRFLIDFKYTKFEYLDYYWASDKGNPECSAWKYHNVDIMFYETGKQSCASIGGIKLPGGHVFLAMVSEGGEKLNSGTVCHELCHYILGVYDEYCYGQGYSIDLDKNGRIGSTYVCYTEEGEDIPPSGIEIVYNSNSSLIHLLTELAPKNYSHFYFLEKPNNNILLKIEEKNAGYWWRNDFVKSDNGQYQVTVNSGYYDKPIDDKTYGIMDDTNNFSLDMLFLSNEDTYSYLTEDVLKNKEDFAYLYTKQLYKKEYFCQEALDKQIKALASNNLYELDTTIEVAMAQSATTSCGSMLNQIGKDESKNEVVKVEVTGDKAFLNEAVFSTEKLLDFSMEFKSDFVAVSFSEKESVYGVYLMDCSTLTVRRLEKNEGENGEQIYSGKFDNQKSYILYVLTCSGETVYYNEYEITSFSEIISEGYYEPSGKTIANLTEETVSNYVVVNETFDYAEGEYNSIGEAVQIHFIDTVNDAYIITKNISSYKDIDVSSVRVCLYGDAGYEIIDCSVGKTEDGMLSVSFECKNEGTYVVQAKPAADTLYNVVESFSVQNGSDIYDGQVAFCFSDTNDDTDFLAYNLYYSDVPFSDIREDVSCITLMDKKSEYTLDFSDIYGTLYFAIQFRGKDGGKSALSEVVCYENISKDSDGDGIPDKWVNTYSAIADLEDIAGTDSDDDGLTNLQEYERGTNPLNPDTDGDNVYDCVEVWNNLDPLKPMTDDVTDDYILVYGTPDVEIDTDSFSVDATTGEVSVSIVNNTEGKAMRATIYLYVGDELVDAGIVNFDANSSVEYTFSREHLVEGMRIVVDEGQITRDTDYSNNEFVYVPAESITITNPEITLVKGLNLQLEYVLTPEGASRIVEWKTADKSIVAVDGKGVIRGIKIGETTVTVTTISGFTGTYKILIEPFLGAGSTDFDCRLINNNTEVEITGYLGSETEVTVPDSIGGYPVTAMADGDYNNYELEKINIGAGVTSISATAFEGYSELKSIEVSPDNTAFRTESGVLFNSDMTELLCYPRYKEGETYSVPETVTVLGENAFANTQLLNDVSLSANITEIKSKAFYYTKVTVIRYEETPTKWTKIKKATDTGINNKQTIIYGKHTLTFVVDGEVYSQADYKIGEPLSAPETKPTKENYVFLGWEGFPDKMGHEDVRVNAIFKAIAYTATFIHNGEVIGTDTFTVEDESLDYPLIPNELHYIWEWEEHSIVASDIVVEGYYVPVTYTINYVSNGKTVKVQEYNVETLDTITPPAFSLPAKTGYHSEWENRNGQIGNLTLNELYVPNSYTVKFWCEDSLIRTSTFTIETQKEYFSMPAVPEKSGYKVVWDDFTVEAKDMDIHGEYVPITYTATFVADGKVISTQNFTVESTELIAPEIPQKAGYVAQWSGYTISAGDKVITARYWLPEADMPAKRTLYAGGVYRLTPVANFEITEKVWASSDTSVATVDSSGVVTAVGGGKCNITVTCYGKDSFGNEIKATSTTKIIVGGEKNDAPKTFREMFDEFFEVTLHEILFNFKAFLVVLFKYAY